LGTSTELLIRWNEGDRAALDELTTVTYDELRKLARVHLRLERQNHILPPTALVHNVLDLNDALEMLAATYPDQCKVVELRFFGGLTIEETVEVIGLSHATIERYWSFARAWLRREMSK
jgi:DNA-directed RNA polymerase specialized sigma24 family protein